MFGFEVLIELHPRMYTFSAFTIVNAITAILSLRRRKPIHGNLNFILEFNLMNVC